MWHGYKYLRPEPDPQDTDEEFSAEFMITLKPETNDTNINEDNQEVFSEIPGYLPEN